MIIRIAWLFLDRSVLYLFIILRGDDQIGDDILNM